MAAIERHGGNVSAAALELGMTYHGLNVWLRGIIEREGRAHLPRWNRKGRGPQHDHTGKSGETREKVMSEFKQYRRKQIAELRPFDPEEALEGVSVSDEDRKAGSPRPGDMIARNPKNHADKWLVAAAYFADNFEEA